jgi:hypothetical protein
MLYEEQEDPGEAWRSQQEPGGTSRRQPAGASIAMSHGEQGGTGRARSPGSLRASLLPVAHGSALMPREVAGGARGWQEELGEPRGTRGSQGGGQEEPGLARRSQQEPGGDRRNQEGFLAPRGSSWLLLAPPCWEDPWLLLAPSWLDPPGSFLAHSWLPLSPLAPDSSWLPLAAPGWKNKGGQSLGNLQWYV